VVLNMVASADGQATLDGRAGPLGGEADRELFHGLRTQVDAVMAGARAVALERYRRLVRDPERRELRRRLGLAPDPLAVLISGHLNLTSDIPLLQDEHSRVVIATGSSERLHGCRARIEYLCETGHALNLTAMLGRQRTEYKVRSLLCEGESSLNSALLREGLVDELFLTVAGKLVGGSGALTIVSGLLPHPIELELVWVLCSGSDVFSRYRVLSETG
jgi:riboflavin biosynthesis pyrimidine reductase